LIVCMESIEASRRAVSSDRNGASETDFPPPGSSEMEPCTTEARRLLDELYAERDLHFAECVQRTQLEEEIRQITAAIPHESPVQPPSVRALLLYIRGKALNALPEFDVTAHKCLARSLKLDPTMAEAWTAMGSCLVKREDFVGAQICFDRALEIESNKESLQMLSMVMRKLRVDPEERLQLVVEALNCAQEALKFDVSDSYSWYLLGNAHLVHFFEVSHDPEDLKKVQQAYQQAVTF